jgi:hypothetical protein
VQRRVHPILILVPLNIVLGLWFEAYGAAHGWLWAEWLVGLVTAFHFTYYFLRPPTIAGTQLTKSALVACLLLATLGELILSALWNLYTYRVSVLPLFVPPGHVLLFLMGLTVAGDKRCGNWVIYLVPLLALPVILFANYSGADFFSLVLFAICLPCLFWGVEPKLYSVMFVLALSLELIGTTLGAWVWAGESRGIGLTLANPPIAAGVFYALLDLLTFRIVRLINDKNRQLV